MAGKKTTGNTGDEGKIKPIRARRLSDSAQELLDALRRLGGFEPHHEGDAPEPTPFRQRKPESE